MIPIVATSQNWKKCFLLVSSLRGDQGQEELSINPNDNISLVSIVSSLEASPNCWAELKQENAELTKRVSVMGRKRYKLKSSTSIPTICNEFYF
jgi:hypothetical protein